MPYDLTYMWYLKNKEAKQNKNRLIHMENKWVVAQGQGGGGVLDEIGRGDRRYKSPALK